MRTTKHIKLNYLAEYICIVSYLQQLNILPKIVLYSNRNVTHRNIDMVVDIGNSRTCAVLFDNNYDSSGDNEIFTKVDLLALQNFTKPVKNGKLNKHAASFDMLLAFREADFGGEFKQGSRQFVFPSMVRLGTEANQLINEAPNLEEDLEKNSVSSSPKRYLWDNKQQLKEWGYVTLESESKKPIWINGISEQLNSDGSLVLSEEDAIGTMANYSRKSLMTFAFLEIFAQSVMYVNSYDYRIKRGNKNEPRKINRAIITCPTTMSRIEQSALRKCAEEASILLNRFYGETYDDKIIKVIPSHKNLSDNREQKEWIYDEATCVQFVYLYAEISKRYLNNCKKYFDFYGKKRKDTDENSEKSLTIGSLDIGAGTSDLVISSYKYDNKQPCTLTPVPLFFESFYSCTGDDLLKELIRQIVIEGPNAAIQKRLEEMKQNNITGLINLFFGENNAMQGNLDRLIRKKFNLQVSIPVAEFFLELLRKNEVEEIELKFDDIFTENKPTACVLDHFKKHFGFALEELTWLYKKDIVSKVTGKIFDPLARKISTLLSYYSCDFVLLSGRPASLKPLADLFLKYYAVAPNRLISLNNYRIGGWYPFNEGNGYVNDAKSIVPVGALIGHYASTGREITGFSLNLDELKKKLLPTSDYFVILNNTESPVDESFITPIQNTATIETNAIPIRIGCRKFDIPLFPCRPLYKIAYNLNEIIHVNDEIYRIRGLMPLKITIERKDYNMDKEKLRIVSVRDKNGNNLPSAYFSLQIQSISESETHWLDTGEFSNLNITHINP